MPTLPSLAPGNWIIMGSPLGSLPYKLTSRLASFPFATLETAGSYEAPVGRGRLLVVRMVHNHEPARRPFSHELCTLDLLRVASLGGRADPVSRADETSVVEKIKAFVSEKAQSIGPLAIHSSLRGRASSRAYFHTSEEGAAIHMGHFAERHRIDPPVYWDSGIIEKYPILGSKIRDLGGVLVRDLSRGE